MELCQLLISLTIGQSVIDHLSYSTFNIPPVCLQYWETLFFNR